MNALHGKVWSRTLADAERVQLANGFPTSGDKMAAQCSEMSRPRRCQDARRQWVRGCSGFGWHSENRQDRAAMRKQTKRVYHSENAGRVKRSADPPYFR